MSVEVQQDSGTVRIMPDWTKVVQGIKRKHGEDFYEQIGRKGGNAVHTKPRGFAAMPKERVRELAAHGGKLGGTISRRGKRVVK